MNIQQAAVWIMGYLASDPEVKVVKNGTLTVTEFTVGVNGPGKEEASFIPCSAFGEELAELLRNATKGSSVALYGRLRQSKWEKDGQKMSRLAVLVSHVAIRPKRKESEAKPASEEITANDLALAEAVTEFELPDEWPLVDECNDNFFVATNFKQLQCQLHLQFCVALQARPLSGKLSRVIALGIIECRWRSVGTPWKVLLRACGVRSLTPIQSKRVALNFFRAVS